MTDATARTEATARTNVKIQRALLSVFDKAGLVDLGQALVGHGVELVSTGGSAAALPPVAFPR
jgi:AICAR transformylase/IMP cyclohydrolase PurH